MNGTIKLNLGGEDRILRFNNFSAIELAKIIYKDEMAKPDMDDLLQRVNDLNTKNHYLLIKTLIYAGIIGNDYVIGFNESVTPEEVGEWIADLDEENIYKVWVTFWDAMGVNLPKIQDMEAERVSEKKN